MTEFDDQTHWGHYAPKGFEKFLMRLCHALPCQPPVFYTLNKGLRRPLKSGRLRLFDVDVLNLQLRLQNYGNYCETTALLAPQFYDSKEFLWLEKHLSANDIFLDVGGNIGLYSLYAAKAIPGLIVHTVEPDQQLSRRMAYNANNNGLTIQHADIALSDFNGTAQLDTGAKQSGENILRTSSTDSSDSTPATDAVAMSVTHPVKVTTLLELCDSKNITAIAMMKIDIEGHEHRVLAHFFGHAPSTLWPSKIIIEHVHDRDGVMQLLIEQTGYKVLEQTPRNSLLTLDQSPQ